MLGAKKFRVRWWQLLLALLIMSLTVLFTGHSLAGRLTDLPRVPVNNSSALQSARYNPDAKSAPSRPLDDAFLDLTGSLDTFGTLGTNPNSGDTVNTGDRFVLDLFVHAGSHNV